MEWYKRYTNRSNHGQLFKAGFWGGVVFDALCDSSAAYDLNGRLPKVYAEAEYLQRQLRLTQADIGVRHDPSRDARDASCDARDGVTQLLNDAVRMCFEAQLIRLEGDLVVIDGWERRQPKPSQSDAERSRKYREKKKNERLNKAAFEPIETVTNRHEASRDASRGVTPRVEESREEKNRIEDPVDSENESTSETTTAALKAKKQKKPQTPEEAARRKSLITALEALFSRFMGSPYTWAGGRDFQALKRLMAQHPDPVILLRWERGLLAEGWLHTSTIAQLALKFNDLAKSQSATQSASADIYDPEKQRARIAAQLAEFEPRPIRMVPRKPEPQESEKTHDDA